MFDQGLYIGTSIHGDYDPAGHLSDWDFHCYVSIAPLLE